MPTEQEIENARRILAANKAAQQKEKAAQPMRDRAKANRWMQENLPEVVAFLKRAIGTTKKRE